MSVVTRSRIIKGENYVWYNRIYFQKSILGVSDKDKTTRSSMVDIFCIWIIKKMVGGISKQQSKHLVALTGTDRVEDIKPFSISNHTE